MGDRYTLEVHCPCGRVARDVWYAPTSGAMTHKCPCGRVTDLEKYSGINAEATASTEDGRRAVRRLRKEIDAAASK